MVYDIGNFVSGLAETAYYKLLIEGDQYADK